MRNIIKIVLFISFILFVSGCTFFERPRYARIATKKMNEYLEEYYNVETSYHVVAKYGHKTSLGIFDDYYLGYSRGMFTYNGKEYRIVYIEEEDKCYDELTYNKVINPIIKEYLSSYIGQMNDYFENFEISLNNKYLYDYPFLYSAKDNDISFDKLIKETPETSFKLYFKSNDYVVNNNVEGFKRLVNDIKDAKDKDSIWLTIYTNNSDGNTIEEVNVNNLERNNNEIKSYYYSYDYYIDNDYKIKWLKRFNDTYVEYDINRSKINPQDYENTIRIMRDYKICSDDELVIKMSFNNLSGIGYNDEEIKPEIRINSLNDYDFYDLTDDIHYYISTEKHHYVFHTIRPKTDEEIKIVKICKIEDNTEY